METDHERFVTLVLFTGALLQLGRFFLNGQKPDSDS
jgi:hypothetical protein